MAGTKTMGGNAAGAQTLVLLIGNSKNLWPCFVEACKQDSNLLGAMNPLDCYIESSVQATVQSLPG